MFGNNDPLREAIELELLTCGNCRGRCNCPGRNRIGELVEDVIVIDILDGGFQ
jgi:hypothetical protein